MRPADTMAKIRRSIAEATFSRAECRFRRDAIGQQGGFLLWESRLAPCLTSLPWNTALLERR
jgi:hypothetical protein